MDKVIIRPWTQSDCDYIYKLQIIPRVRDYFKDSSVPSYIEHQKWFGKFLESNKKFGFIIYKNGEPCGFVRVNLLYDLKINSEVGELSIVVDPNFSSSGVGASALNLCIRILSLKDYRARVHKDNSASLRLFGKMGFIAGNIHEDFIIMYLKL